MLFQVAGNVDKCAQLSASACVVCAHLGGRFFADLASGDSSKGSFEARQCLGHCYIMDKSLAMSLGRRSFLPDMEINASMLVPPAPNLPSAPIFNIYLEFAKIQDQVAREMRLSPTGGVSTSDSLDGVGAESRLYLVVRKLRAKMEDIRVKIKKVRSKAYENPGNLLHQGTQILTTCMRSFDPSHPTAQIISSGGSGWALTLRILTS